MQSFNHVAGGFAFTGLFCSFADVNIFADVDVMAVVWCASVLPDIDHTKSISGKVVYPLAKWIQTKYGHRTVTHSIFFYLAVVIIVKAVDNLWYLHYTLPVALALGSHLIFDMCTKQGIPIFYPFSRRPAVLPANPKLRLSANDFRSEAIIFVLFCCLNVFSYPLMASGFWTRYNKSFATWDHLQSEMQRKPADYETRFLYQGTDTIKAVMVERKASELIVFRGGKFERFEADKTKLIDFKALSTKHEFKVYNLFQISVDSLNQHMKKNVVTVTAQSNEELFYFQGPIMKKGTEITAEYPNGAMFQKIAIDNRETEARILLLTAEYKQKQKLYALELAKIQALRDELEHERTRQASNDFDEGERRQRVKVLTEKLSQVQEPERPDEEICNTHLQIEKLKLRESSHINASLLIWEARRNQN